MVSPGALLCVNALAATVLAVLLDCGLSKTFAASLAIFGAVPFSINSPPTLALFAYNAALRPQRPALSTLGAAPWWVWAGGLLGAVFVTAGAAFAPRLGAATFISVTIAGQVIVSILLDHFGALGFAARPVTPPRLLGALLLVAGVLLVRKF